MIGWTPPPGRDQTGRVAAPALVGRARQLAALRDALARAVTGEGGVLVVSGDPGIGKSALIEAAMGTVDVARFVGHAVPEWVQAGPGGGGDRRRGPRRRRPPRRPPGGPVPAPRGGADRHRPGRAGRGAGSGRVRPVRRRRRGGAAPAPGTGGGPAGHGARRPVLGRPRHPKRRRVPRGPHPWPPRRRW